MSRYVYGISDIKMITNREHRARVARAVKENFVGRLTWEEWLSSGWWCKDYPAGYGTILGLDTHMYLWLNKELA